MEILDINDKVLLDVPGDTLRFADLPDANLQKAKLHRAFLRYADLRKANLENADLEGADLCYVQLCYSCLVAANLQFVDLRFGDLRHADLRKADLRNAALCYSDLRHANLENADLRYIYFSKNKLKGARLPYFDETPTIPNIHKAVYEAASAPNALDMRTWHTCETIHSWIGWVVTLAGEMGRKLERKVGTDVAAALIYMKSDPELEQSPNLIASNEEALLDMRRLAGL